MVAFRPQYYSHIIRLGSVITQQVKGASPNASLLIQSLKTILQRAPIYSKKNVTPCSIANVTIPCEDAVREACRELQLYHNSPSVCITVEDVMSRAKRLLRRLYACPEPMRTTASDTPLVGGSTCCVKPGRGAATIPCPTEPERGAAAAPSPIELERGAAAAPFFTEPERGTATIPFHAAPEPVAAAVALASHTLYLERVKNMVCRSRCVHCGCIYNAFTVPETHVC